MTIDRNIKLPQKFWNQYKLHVALRLIGSAAFLLLCCILCFMLDLSHIKYPVMAVIMVFAVGIALACILFRLHTILFQKSWTGKITNIEAKNKIKTGNKARPTRKFVVTLTIDRGDGIPFFFELMHEDQHGENKYYTEAPYKLDDTVIYLRGLKYPMRYHVGDTPEFFDPLFVCPYCGEINKADRETCYRCGKLIVK